MIDVEEIRIALQRAFDEAVASLLREGLDKGEAGEEALEYVGIPDGVPANQVAVQRFVSDLGPTAVPAEFVEFVSHLSAGQIYVWDADFRPMRGVESRFGDAYLDTVFDQTMLLREQTQLSYPGVVCGSSQHGDPLFLTAEPDAAGYSVLTLSHEDAAVQIPAARSLVGYLLGNASVAASYWRRVQQEESAEADWVEAIVGETDPVTVAAPWIRYSLSQRPRPI